jgi:ribosomal protein S18 acetylase RimI-like enzyme
MQMKNNVIIENKIALRPLRIPQDRASLLTYLRLLYQSIDETTLLARLAEVQQHGWECIVAVEHCEDTEKVLGLTGYWLQTRMCYGKYLYVDHFIVSTENRCSGVGGIMWNQLECIARDSSCERIVLDTFVTNSVAQRFWMNHGCSVVGFHFGKAL